MLKIDGALFEIVLHLMRKLISAFITNVESVEEQMQDGSGPLCEHSTLHCPTPGGYFPGILCVPTSTQRTDRSVCAYLYQSIICI